MSRILSLITAMLMVTSLVYAGGVDPKEMPAAEPVKKEKVTATPAQTTAAVSKARKAVPPVIKEERIVAPQPKAATQPRSITTKPAAKAAVAPKAASTAWMLGNGGGSCAPLSSIANKVNVGTYTSPKDLAQKMRQRGFQAFALDVGDTPDTVYKVRIPDKQLDLTFVREGLCR